jgi:hypothetical protein
MAKVAISGGRGGRRPKPTLNSKLTKFARAVPGIVGSSIIEGIGGPKARGAKAAVRVIGRARNLDNLGKSTASRVQKKIAAKEQLKVNARANSSQIKANKKRRIEERTIKARRTTTGQRRVKVSDKVAGAMANAAAGPKAGAPFGRIRTTAKPNSGRGLSKSEEARDVYYKSKQNPVTTSQGKPKPKRIVSKAEKDFIRRQEIRKAISGKPGKRAPEVAKKEDKPVRSIREVIAPLKGKKVVVEKRQALENGKIVNRNVRMDAQEYVLTRANFKGAKINPENSVAPRTRAQEKTRADAIEADAIREARREEIIQRLREIKDTEAAKTNRRYSSPAQERGNVRQTEGLIAQGEKRIQEETARRRIEQEKIARTAKRRKEVEATLQKVKDRDAARRAKQRVKDTDANRLKVKPNRPRRAK